MPSYDYKCKTCGKVFMAKHAIGRVPTTCDAMTDDSMELVDVIADGETTCVGDGNLERLYALQGKSNIGIHLKGTGFYNTDYKNHKQ